MRLIDLDDVEKKLQRLSYRIFDKRGIEYEDLYELLKNAPPIDAIPIPKGATNGDMIKAMFCDARIWQSDSYHMAVEFKDALCIKLFEIKWWNAPYKENINE